MALSLRSTATTNSGSSTTPSVTLPSSGQANDLMVVIISHNDGTVTVADNNGATPMTEDYDAGNDAGGMGIAIYTRKITGSEPSTLNFNLSVTNRWAITSFILAGQDTTTAYDVAISTFDYQLNATNPTCAQCTTNTNGAWAIALLSIDSGTNTITGGPGGSWTQIATVNSQQPIAVYYLNQATAGATGTATFTNSASTNSMGMRQFAFKPAAAAAAATPATGFMTTNTGFWG